MNREALDTGCERAILVLVLVILVFGPLATGAAGPLGFLIIQALTMGVMVLWGARLWLTPRPRLLWPPICWFVVLFAAYAVSRYLTADIEYVARRELIRVLVYAFLFFAILNNLHRQESTQIIGFTLIFLAAGISFYALSQFLTGSGRVWWYPGLSQYKGRASGTYICPNHLAGFLEMVLPLALAYTVAGRGKALTKILLGYAALVMVAGIGVTFSRGGWASCGAALVLIFGVLAMNRNHRLPALLILVGLLAGGAYFIAKADYFKLRSRKILQSEYVEYDGRYRIWDAALRMWEDRFWFGVGPGHFNYRFGQYRPLEMQLRPDLAHNDYLNALADWGAVGGAIVAGALGALILGVWRTWKSVWRSGDGFGTNKSNRFAFVLGAAGGLFAILVHSLVDFNMQIPANAILAISLMALLSGYLRFTTEGYWVSARLWQKAIASVVLLLGLGYLASQEARLGREYYWLRKTLPLPMASAAQVAALEQAARAEPANFETACAIGEAYRTQSWDAELSRYEELAKKAMDWYGRALALNRYDAISSRGMGMCLDWLDRNSEADRYFNLANECEPNSYLASAYAGWHYFQRDDYIAAKRWFERSLKLQWKDNPIATSHLQMINEALLEKANPRKRY